jgi:predicted MPP superfamily phosphohydrolase
MRTLATIIFIGIFFTLTGLISYYIFIRGLQSIPAHSGLRNTYIVVFWIVALSFMGGRLLENVLPSSLANLFIWVGSFWIAAMLYFLMAVVLLDLVRVANHFLSCFPAVITNNYPRAKSFAFIGIAGSVALLLLGGYINSIIPRVTRLDLTVAGKASKLAAVNIVAASDIHLGTIVGRSRIDSIVDRINNLDPDLVILPGDIVDEDLTPVIKQNLGDAIRNIRSRYGVYAITGNHEYIGGVEKACAYLTAHNVVMIRDQCIKIADSFFLVGREDRSKGRVTGVPRKALPELMKEVDRNYPVILLDHQPFGLEEAVAQGADLQISGHTHDGQLWPINYIVESIYELAWGYKKIRQTHFYVSSGVGTWGPPVRIGNYPEILQIHLHFQ